MKLTESTRSKARRCSLLAASLSLFSCALGGFLLVLAAPAPALAEDGEVVERLPESLKVTALRVHPERVVLAGRFEAAQVLISGDLEDGGRIDLTRIATVRVAGEVPDAIAYSREGRVTPRKDGHAVIQISHGDHSASLEVEVSGQAAEPQVSFTTDVMPVLSKIGCNAGTCHGSQKGRNGFKLSLRGYDALFDHEALTDDMEGRRFNRAAPDRSLFLMKLSGDVPHVGGVLTRPGEPYYELLRAWVAGGVQMDTDAPHVDKLEVIPSSLVVPLPEMRQQMAVIATYTDGRKRDVTREAILETSNIEVTSVSRSGIVTAIRRGEAAVLARYQGRYATAPVFVMGDRSGFEWKDVAEYNYIDTLIYKKLQRIKTSAAALCTDEEFLRRLYLDLTGIPPRPKETRAFLRDGRDSRVKREELVERLLGNAEFVEHWTNKWSDLLQVNSKWLGKDGAEIFHEWIAQAIASNMPYDHFAAEILGSSGTTYDTPPAAYYKILRKPEELMENTTQLFLGIRFNCNKCHDHPFERWTQSNYWELSAFFAQVGRKDVPGSPRMPQTEIVEGAPAPPTYNEEIYDLDTGDVVGPRGGIVAPEFPYEHKGGTLASAKSRRAQLTAWLTSRDNPYFARSFVNRLWSYFLGVGFIDPVDDIRAGNPSTNPELLDRLTADFIESGFDVRKLMRLIVTSRVYQHSIQSDRWNEDDTTSFSHALARRLPAETLFDAIHLATGSPVRVPGVRHGTRAASFLDPTVKSPDGFLEIFGRPPRESACECERVSGMSLGQALSLVNGDTVSETIRDPQNLITDLVTVEPDNRQVVEELFISFLARRPTEPELEQLTATLAPNPQNAESLRPDDRKTLEERFQAWLATQAVASWQPLEAGVLRSEGGATFQRLEDGSVLVTGTASDKDVYTISAFTPLEAITGVRLEVLPDDSLPAKGPGRADNGNLVLSEVRAFAASAKDPAQAKAIALQNATADFSQDNMPVAQAIDGDPAKGWAIAPRFGAAHEAIFEAKEDAGFAGGTLVTFTLEQAHGSKHTIGRLRLSVTASPRPIRFNTLPAPITAALLKPPAERTPQEQGLLLDRYLGQDGEMREKIRLANAQDIAWALANSPAFIFNR